MNIINVTNDYEKNIIYSFIINNDNNFIKKYY